MSIADISPAPSPTRRGSDFADLSRGIKRAGLLQRRYGYYAVRIAVNVALLVVGGVAFVLLGDSWWQLFTAVFLAVVFTQFGFMGHDAGHKADLRLRPGQRRHRYTHAPSPGCVTSGGR